MKCPRCQHENPPAQKFCGECGAGLTAACRACGASNPPEQRFCGECGASLDAPPTSRFASAQQYTPKHLAERILSSKEALEGERKQITVLFADLKGSTELIADRDPEEARKLLDPVLEKMMEAVHRYEGTVNQVMGDGIMALFGAPLALEDHAVRACYAALAMQAAIRGYSEQLRRSKGVEVQIRVGLNSGEVVVRSIGSDLRMDYTAVGQTTHLAARMEQLATPGTTRLTADTLRLAEGLGAGDRAGTGPAQGVDRTGGGLRAHQRRRGPLAPAGCGGARADQVRGAQRRALSDVLCLERSHAGHGQVVALVGEPGVGKSRLVWEFTHSHRARDWLVLESASVSYGKASAYRPVIDLLKSYFQIEDRDDARRIREKVTGKLLALDEALKPPSRAPARAAGRAGRGRALEGARSGAEAAAHPGRVQKIDPARGSGAAVAAVFEDLHWIDSETQAMLDALVESLPAARVLLLVNFRPEYEHRWGGKTYYRQLRIDPLPPESADELLEALLGRDAALGPLKQLLVERTEANPLFLEESVRALVETAALAGERGAYRLTRAVEQLDDPPTVQAILAARIDRLGPETKRLLQAAAVIGKDVPMPLLLAIADGPEHEVRAELTHLQAAEFLYEVRLFPDLEYTFKHALTHEVAYQGVLHDRQRALHARITEAIERLAPDRVAEQVERLAHHALRGEVWDKAVGYLRQAGLRSTARAANREAIAHLEQALEALRRHPASRETTELTIDIRLELRNALLPLGERARIRDHLHEAEALARALGDQQRLARIATFMVIECVVAGDYEEAVRFGQEALGIARSLGYRSSEVVATTFLGQAHAVRGEFGTAATLFERNVALEGDLRFERFGAPGIQWAVSGAWLADVFSQLGRFDEAIGHAEAAGQVAEAADHPFSLHLALFALGRVHLGRGDLPRATRVLEQDLDLCRTRQLVVAIPLVAATLGAAFALAGRADDALPLVADAVEDFRRRQNHTQPAFILLCAGTTCLSAGRIDEAASYAREALVLTRRLGARGSEAHALCLAGDVASAGSAEDAAGYYRDALALAGELGMRPIVAHCHLGLGKLSRRTGKRDQAQEHLRTAVTMYREMDMRFWLEQAKMATTELA